jgi:hypothetical protein
MTFVLRGGDAAVLAFQFEKIRAAASDEQQIGAPRRCTKAAQDRSFSFRSPSTERNMRPPNTGSRAPLQVRDHAALQSGFGLAAASHGGAFASA